ncbi:MAG: hypothetical protein SH856_03765 [Flavobacteriales bacterium]|nr:hypothetical protein [Flavobacteriales bacterium]
MMSFDSASKNTTIQFKGDTMVRSTPSSYVVARSSRPLTLVVNRNGKDTTYFIKHRIDKMFWLNLVTAGSYYGMIVDAFSSKKFTYPNQILITDSCLQTRQYSNLGLRKYWAGELGDVRVHFGIPLFTQRDLYTSRGYTSPFGIFGFESGIEYFAKRGRSFGFNFGFVPDFPEVICYYGCADSQSSYMRMETRWEKGKWYPGVGLQYGSHNYTQYKSVEDSVGWYNLVETYSYQSKTLGAAFSLDYRMSPMTYVGIDYMPSFLSLENGAKWRYQQTWLFVHFKFRFNLNQKWKFRNPIVHVVGNVD